MENVHARHTQSATKHSHHAMVHCAPELFPNFFRINNSTIIARLSSVFSLSHDINYFPTYMSKWYRLNKRMLTICSEFFTVWTI